MPSDKLPTPQSAIDHPEPLASEVDLLRSKLAAAERRLEERGSFLAVMSHELREPINGVLGMARLLQETSLDDEQAAYVDTVVDSAESLVTLVNDVLDLSRIDAGRIEFNPVDFALPAFFQRLAEVFSRRASAKGIHFVLDLAPDLPQIARGDPGRLRQIATNILANAIKFTSRGNVSLAVSAVEDVDAGHISLRLRIADTGIGIPPNRQSTLFSPFTQATAETGRLYGGSGLGLMIAQRLAKLMSGSLVLESSTKSGTVFVARIVLEFAKRSRITRGARYDSGRAPFDRRNAAAASQAPRGNCSPLGHGGPNHGERRRDPHRSKRER